jgi:hypothetical protein
MKCSENRPFPLLIQHRSLDSHGRRYYNTDISEDQAADGAQLLGFVVGLELMSNQRLSTQKNIDTLVEIGVTFLLSGSALNSFSKKVCMET